MKTKRISAYGLMLIVSVIWGVATPVIKYTLSYFSPSVFLTYRFFLSTIVALLYFTLNPSTLPKTRSSAFHSLIHSICVVILGLGLLFVGVNYTDALTGSLLAATGPLFSIVLGNILLKERISRNELIGLVLSLTGSILTVFTGDGMMVLGFLGVAMFGNMIILLSRVADAYGSVSIKQALKQGMDPSALAHISFIIGFIFFAVLTMNQGGGLTSLVHTIISAPLAAHLGVFYMAFISGTLGYILANKALGKMDLGEASIFNYLTVVWAAPLSILWLHDPLTPQFIAGAGLIALGVIIAEWHRKKRLKKRKR